MLLQILFTLLNLGLGFGTAVLLKRRLTKPNWFSKETVESAEQDQMQTSGVQIEELEQQEEAEEIDIAGPDDIPNEWSEVLYQEALTPQSLIEGAVHLLRIASNQLLDKLIDVGVELSKIKTVEDAADSSGLTKELVLAEETWLKDLESVKETLDQHQGRFGPLTEFHISLDMSLTSQSEGATNAKEAVDNVNFGREFSEEKAKLQDLLRNRLDAITSFYDFLNDGFAEIVSLEGRLDSVDSSLTIDARSGILNACGLAQSVFEWRSQSESNLTFALIEIDDMNELKHFAKIYIGDRIFQAVARVIEGNVRKNRGFDRVCQYSSHRLILVFGGTEQRFASIPVERIRRTISGSKFRYGNSTLKIKVRAAIGEVSAQDEIIDVIDRLEKGLEAAKEHATTCSVIHNGLEFEPIPENDDYVRTEKIDIEVREPLLT